MWVVRLAPKCAQDISMPRVYAISHCVISIFDPEPAYQSFLDGLYQPALVHREVDVYPIIWVYHNRRGFGFCTWTSVDS